MWRELAVDGGRLIQRASGVWIDQQRKQRLAAKLANLRAKASATFRTRIDQRVEVERAQGFAHQTAIRTGLDVVQLQWLRRLFAGRPASDRSEERRVGKEWVRPGECGGME